ncbi:3-hydroxyacyl-CoA dehydrogenase NAD-binding domain-containing protein [Mangrovicella endophytica]|uniref:3-hydroxyacyl-CoA dehydrogenase NAD-binding domain-containing protein n=1 Tax=Mangrovicella endophytica TaxID=2066697 RepID=UPI000C9E6420|nr:3-hydroxyacyl-CoA dehydrogenase NAD-binding domain-containing protein [Mangrovicella endophytica]
MKTMLNALKDRRLELGAAADAAPQGNWRSARDADGVVWLVLDRPDKSVNVIDRAVLEELNAHLERLEAERPRAVVIRSGKSAGFAAGADIRQFTGASIEDMQRLLTEGHAVFDRLERLSSLTIAVIHGHCLGGGLELALACKRRIATADATLGFPEVMLGLHPGLGGTFRSIAVADPVEAMTMMLTGRSLPARKAKSIGLVDAVVEERHVAAAVRAAAAGQLAGAKADLKDRALSLRPARSFAASRMRKTAAEKAPKEHYPAPYALIDLWEAHGGDRKAMQAAEIDSFARLITSDTAQSLIRVFFLREAMKGQKQGKSAIRHVHVVGAGAMGGDIAAWAAKEGFDVTLADVANASIGKAVKAATKMLQATLKDPVKVRDALDRLVPDPQGHGVRHADIVIEAVPEKLELKRSIYAAIEPRLKEGALLATNTSAIPLDELVAGLRDPSRFVGLHFFNPVSRMQLVEIVSHAAIHAETRRRAIAFATELSRLPAAVASAPGFLVNRSLTPYIAEALILADEGIPKERIDHAAEAFGMPMGPIELIDQVGIDVALDVVDGLRPVMHGFPQAPEWLRQKRADGKLGRKSGEGLYRYDSEGKPAKQSLDALPDSAPNDPDIADRLILPMLNAVVACLREGVVEEEDIADGAMIFGTGFAPFRGGPIHYARRRGIAEIVARMEALAERHGERFKPDAGWSDLEAR